MIPIRTLRLVLRNWEERDRDLFHRINSDDRVMEFFPYRQSRMEADAMMDEWRGWIEEDGYGFAAVEIAASGECAGFVGLFDTEDLPGLPEGTIEIGWRLAPEHWGHGYATEAARAWLAFGFEALARNEMVSFAASSNVRSTAVMERLGMRRDPSADFDHPLVSDPRLKRHVLYRLTREDWLASR
ncbi:MAG TPA: GNAT family N-acetyltransferase [Rhizobiaceae bacterium]